MAELVQETIEGKDKEKLRDYPEKKLGEDARVKQEESAEQLIVEPGKSLRASIKFIFAGKNYSIYLATAWVYNAFAYMGSFFNLYLRAMGWDFLLIGTVFSITAVLASTTRLLGGYVGDLADRKKLSVIAMLMMAGYYLIIGIFTDAFFIFIGLILLSSFDIVKSGSSAYIMENIPKDHSGLALSLFTAGRILGIGTLLIFGILSPVIGFPESFRLIYLAGGILLLFCTVIRARFLTSSATKKRNTERSVFRDFIVENRRAAKLLVVSVPGLLSVVVIDSISDSFFKFGALIYANEVLMIDISGINLMLLATLILSVPLLLKVGRLSDKRGIKRAALLTYGMMPVSAALLIIAPIIPIWVPESWYLMVENIAPGFGVLFTTAFVAIVMKFTNDTIWWLVVLSLIRKNLPTQDTAKILSIFWVVVYICSSIGPILAGAMFTYLEPNVLFMAILVLNLIILIAIGSGRLGENQKENQHEDAK
ncbi:MAG: MFS transporter [Candidatus Thorarchaeota archaeon]